ncbi:restriction endonuclease [Paracoccus sp. DMF]|uniref:restriction endonuclease n=1 Tax=Paracoccus sp. DMF TaxID=400837 RepID=UPI0021E3605C|nr:restriction endonuclease [Paracoccus sp. DMF]
MPICLRLMAEGARNARDCLPGLRKHFGLSDDAMSELIPSGGRSKIHDRADWALLWMQQAGLTEKIQPGYNVVTPAGLELLASGRLFDRKYVQSLPPYIAWREARKSRSTTASGPAAPPETRSEPNPDEAQTPTELIEFAYQQLDAALAEDLLEQVRTLTPARFERLIVELLLAMGYGDGRAEMGQAIGRSGDGGIDGVVNEDKLGLDAVYIQAKRYAPDNTIGRPALQAFIGSMTGESATKGVFVTTSSFSKDARDYVRRVQQRVVLIDGARLARLMIDHGVGVRIDKTYVLRSIDANFFDVT